MKLLLIEDEKKIASFLKQGFKSEGFTVGVASDGEDGLYKATEGGSWDVVILDVRLPKMDGIQVCQVLRKQGVKTPIIMLTARDSVEERIQGLDAGADDYVTKPFSFSEILARVRAVTRRHQPSLSHQLTVGPLTLNGETFDVTRKGQSIALSATEFRLLHCLAEYSPRVLSKIVLLDKVWGFDFSPESNVVEVYIKYLRDKIDKKFEYPLIHTVHGIGYKLCDLS